MLSPKADKEKRSIQGFYVRVWCEENPNIEWILFTLSPVTSKEEALEIVSTYFYENRVKIFFCSLWVTTRDNAEPIYILI